MRRTSAALAVLALASGSLVAQAPAAHAAINQSFDLETIAGGEPDDGSAHAWGTVSWQNRSKVVITGRINDRCPADGYGAYMDIWIWFANGDAVAKLDVAADDAGCTASSNGVAFSPVTHDANRRISRVEFRLREINQPFTIGDTANQNRSNPFS